MYDSTPDTKNHIEQVQIYIENCCEHMLHIHNSGRLPELKALASNPDGIPKEFIETCDLLELYLVMRLRHDVNQITLTRFKHPFTLFYNHPSPHDKELAILAANIIPTGPKGNLSQFVMFLVEELTELGRIHDASKFSDLEKPTYDKYTPLLRALEYGTPEHTKNLNMLREALTHHYAHNPHHPEHYANRRFCEIPSKHIIEMICDWSAATLRHDSGNIFNSIEFNRKRFKYSQEIADLFGRTVKRLGMGQQ